jgi:hypothetical protein
MVFFCLSDPAFHGNDKYVHQYAMDGRKGADGSKYGPMVIRFAGQPT